jgi:hypothetical protein
MNLTDLIDTIADAIGNDTELKSLNMPFHLGIPPADQNGNALVPCVTLDGLVCLDDKIGTWTANIHLWSDDLTLSFTLLSQHFLSVLDRTGVVQTNGFLNRPEPDNAINSSLYPVRFYIKG